MTGEGGTQKVTPTGMFTRIIAIYAKIIVAKIVAEDFVAKCFVIRVDNVLFRRQHDQN